jgi:DNA polymerase I
MTIISGWLFDAYHTEDSMVLWFKQENGVSVKSEDKKWSRVLYVAGGDNNLTLADLPKRKEVQPYLKEWKIVERRERITDWEPSQVLQITLADSFKAVALATAIEKIDGGEFRLYNVDVLPAQSYFYQQDIFPLAKCKFDTESCRWDLVEDSVWHTDYKLPMFKIVHLDIKINNEYKLPTFSDRLASASLHMDNETITLDSQSEENILQEIGKAVQEEDPDFIFTNNGDTFLLPYLAYRAEQNEMVLALGREPEPLARPKKDGVSYFSYGRIHFKPSPMFLKGRMHLDVDNSFIYDEGGLHGLYEISRICRMPMQKASRASIGKCLSSLQFYHAYKRGLLVPWKPVAAEHFKTRAELIVADRGGLILEPEVGVHEQVAEFDFVSLYPNIMYKKNLSAETIRCSCCPDSTLRVPELDYNICQKHTGLVPAALEIVLKKRKEYKRLKKAAISAQERDVYDARQTSLKWILVTSFGYLGFNNAKFGRIDAHIGVCAFDRQILLQAVNIAEDHGFEVLHGIVDSIWVKKQGSSTQEHCYFDLKANIEQKTGFELAFEGVYKWLVFLPSKADFSLPVANRYFGAFEDGRLKVRGIEARRHDTPVLFARCQMEILHIMAKARDTKEVQEMLPACHEVYQKYADLLLSGEANLQELIFTKRASKDADEYHERDTVEHSARQLLESEGKHTRAGQLTRYVITNYTE